MLCVLARGYCKAAIEHRGSSCGVGFEHREAKKVFLEYPRETFGFPNLFLQKKVLGRRRHLSEATTRGEAAHSARSAEIRPKALKGLGGKQEVSPQRFRETTFHEIAHFCRLEADKNARERADCYGEADKVSRELTKFPENQKSSTRTDKVPKKPPRKFPKIEPARENERVQGFSVLLRTSDLQQCRKSCKRTGRSSGTCRSRPFQRKPSGSPC